MKRQSTMVQLWLDKFSLLSAYAPLLPLPLSFFLFSFHLKKIHHFYIILMFEEEEEHLWIYTLMCDYSLWYKSKKWRYIKFRYTIIIYLCHLLWICELSNIHYFFLSLHLYIEFSFIHNLASMHNNFRLSIRFFPLISFFFENGRKKKKKGRNQFSCGSSYSNSNTAFGFYIWWYWLF